MHLSGVTGAAAPHQLTVLRRRLKGRVVSSDLLARVPTACLIRILPGASIPHSRIRVPWTRSTLKSRNRRRHGRPSARTYRARLRAAFIGPEMSRRRATASAKYRPSLTALPSTGACHFKQWATVSRARRLDVCGRQPLNPRALCVVGASTDASVLLHRARDQAAGAASLAPSCHPEPRLSLRSNVVTDASAIAMARATPNRITAVRCSFMDEPPRARATTPTGGQLLSQPEAGPSQYEARKAAMRRGRCAISSGRFSKEGRPSCTGMVASHPS
jgi:hypothetical protein